MKLLSKIFILKIVFVINLFYPNYSLAENHNFNEIIEQLQTDIKTLEKAVYSDQTQFNNNENENYSNNNSEDVLTRHLLKLSEIEKQFQQLTNRFEK